MAGLCEADAGVGGRCRGPAVHLPHDAVHEFVGDHRRVFPPPAHRRFVRVRRRMRTLPNARSNEYPGTASSESSDTRWLTEADTVARSWFTPWPVWAS